PVVPLEEAVAPLISILPRVQNYTYVAKQRCESVSLDNLTQDESASIMLYSMEWKPHQQCLYFALNATLRRKTFVWWGFSSCTTPIGVHQCLGRTGQRTLFSIECDSGKDISRHTYYRKEKEALLLPARQFTVVSCHQSEPGFHMIQLKETKPPITLLQPATNQLVQIKSTPEVEPIPAEEEYYYELRNIKFKFMYHSLTDQLREEMGRLKVFFMFMGDLISFTNIQNFRNEIKLHPQWNCTYGMGHTSWTGALHDGRDRGPHPYYCPVGWKRYALYVTDNYDDRFKGWSICYHGTKFSYGLSILLSGLKPSTAIEHGAGIHVSPSIIYPSHPRFSEIRKIKPSEETNFFQGGRYVQFMLQCRVHPTSIKKIGPETLRVGNTTIDSNVENSVIEWVIDTKGKGIIDFNDPDATIVCTGIMIRVTDKHPGLLSESQWWYTSHLCNDTNHCVLGIDLTTLKNQKANEDRCNIIFS
ncbi:unnamed protein product, partial [Adineta steineri]